MKIPKCQKRQTGEEGLKPKEPKLKVSGNAILRLFLTPHIQNFGVVIVTGVSRRNHKLPLAGPPQRNGC